MFKSLTENKSLWRKLGSVALVVVVLGGVLFAGAAPTLAAGEGAPPPQEEVDEGGAPRLEFAYLRLQHVAEVQDLRLGQAAEVVDFVQGWIDELAASGEDVTELQAALDTFEAALAEAQGHYEAAKAVLDEHAGFDESGQVTDREAARETLREAGRSLDDARRALSDGATQLRRAIRDWGREQPRSWQSES